MFEDYAAELDRLIPAYADRIVLLKGFEAEIVPHDRYAEIMLGWRKQYGFEYIIGSVHWLDDVIMDYTPASFQEAVRNAGSLERLCLAYYARVEEMVAALDPEVVGHLDLPRKYVRSDADIETPIIRAAAERTLDAIAAKGCILDLNTAGYRKGIGHPYPGPWLMTAARERGIPFCFGDDSHGPHDVGAGIEEARQYLLDHGIDTVTVLTRDETGRVVRQIEPLDVSA
jgi:histidinol-phosphatase (PHP family)